MADENNPSGTNGGGNGRPGSGSNGGSNGKTGKVGLVGRVTTGVKEDIHALKTEIPAKAKADRGFKRSHQDPGLYFHLPPQTRRHATQPGAGRALQRIPAFASGED